MMLNSVTVFGADWCKDTARTRAQLERLGLSYDYLNIDTNPMAKEEVRELNEGRIRIPTVIVEGNGTRILTIPQERELNDALAETEVYHS